MRLLLMTITALATAITAVVAFSSLRNERKKKRMEVFSDSIRVVVDGFKNSESYAYVTSGNYKKDIRTVQYLLNTSKNIGLDDFKKIVYQNLIRGDLSVEERTKLDGTKETLRKSYNKIVYFSERMEYLGMLAKDKDVRVDILNYFGPKIIETYENLEPIITKTREDNGSKNLYLHFTQLYYQAKKRKSIKNK